MKLSRVLFVAGIFVCFPIFALAGPTVNFEDEVTGSSVEGLGTVHPALNIDVVPGPAVVVESFANPIAYGAPNDYAPYFPVNNCLENADGVRVNVDANGDQIKDPGVVAAKGFGVPQATTNVLQTYYFSFAPGVTVSNFSLRIFDFGDYNPASATSHSLTLTAYDDLVNVVDTQVVSFTTPPQINPTSSIPFGNLLNGAGDACDATLGQPGYLEMAVNNPTGINQVVLSFTGQDPKIALDSINFVPCTRTIGFWKNHPWYASVQVGTGETITEADGSVKEAELKEDQGILWNATGKNFSMLCAQLIAAKLNCYGGDCVPGTTIEEADALLAENGVICKDTSTWTFPSKTVKSEAAALAAELDAFNNTYHCMDAPEAPY